MQEKKKIRFNYLFAFTKGEKRKFYQQSYLLSISHLGRYRGGWPRQAGLTRSQIFLREWRVVSEVHCNVVQKSLVQEQMNDASAVETQCQEEMQVIQGEIKRLEGQKKVLEDIILYLNVDACLEVNV